MGEDEQYEEQLMHEGSDDTWDIQKHYKQYPDQINDELPEVEDEE